MLDKIDTGKRRLLVPCDMMNIMAVRPHYKEFKGPQAQLEAELFMNARHLQERGYIEKVMELPELAVPELAVADPDAVLTRLAGELTAGLRNKRTPDSKELRRKLFALHRVLTARLSLPTSAAEYPSPGTSGTSCARPLHFPPPCLSGHSRARSRDTSGTISSREGRESSRIQPWLMVSVQQVRADPDDRE